MAILHGSWVLQPQVQAADDGESAAADPAGTQSFFLLWGETWRRVEPQTGETAAILPHPYALTQDELLTELRLLQKRRQIQWSVAAIELAEPVVAAKGRGKQGTKAEVASAEGIGSSGAVQSAARWQAQTLFLPSHRIADETTPDWVPQHSAAPTGEDSSLPVELHSWQIGGFWLTPLEAAQFLNSLPLASVSEEDSFVAGDLRFWSHTVRWSLDLMARSKYLPGIQRSGEAARTCWQVLLDSDTDQTRLRQFSQQMPPICRAYISSSSTDTTELPEFPQPRRLLLGFLNAVVDAQIRQVATQQPLPPASFPKDLPLREWLRSLGTDANLPLDPGRLERLNGFLNQWVAPLQRHLSQEIASFRTAFTLTPPLEGRTDWHLEFGLQAADDPSFWVSARIVWQNPVDRLFYQGRTIDQPQETLLAGLGLASRLYPAIEPGLQSQQPSVCPLAPLQVYDFLKSTAWRLQDSGFGVVLPPSLASEGGWANRLGLSVRAQPPKDKGLGLNSLLNFQWELTIGGQRLTKSEFDRLVAQNTPLVEINGEWVELRPQDVRAAQNFFATRKDQMTLSLEDALRISTGDTQMIEKLPVVSFEASGALEELINALTKGNQSIETIATPASFRGELRPYQERGVAWLAFLQKWGLGACLADDMGLGKTIQMITLLLHLKESDELTKPTLLVCPTSVIGNWEREVKRFAPSLKVLVHHGDKRSQSKTFATDAKKVHLVITSYTLAHRDEKTLQGVSWQGVVLDEAQNIKNPDAKQSQAVRNLETEFRIALTGTPVENRLSELWSILDFLNPGYLGPKNFFQRRFAIPIERYGDTDSLRTLRSLVQPFILRRLKTDRDIIQDLPEKQEMTVFCGLTANQAAAYQKLVDTSLEQIDAAEGIQRRGMILALLTKLKQVCNYPGLLKGEDAVTGASLVAGSGKLQRLEEMLEELLAEGDRTLIFTQFAEWGKLMQRHLEQQFKREVLFLYGSTTRPQREEMVDRFQNDPQGPRIFILSLKAGGVGLNLTRANHVFHFDRWWNPAVENQATDRAFRIGQTRNVQVHKFVCTGTLEEKIHEIIESKKALAEQIVGEGESWLTDLDTDQLRNLLLLDRTAVIDD